MLRPFEHQSHPRQLVVAFVVRDEAKCFDVAVATLNGLDQTEQDRRIETARKIDADRHVRAKAKSNALA